jgi:hypothetical protein
MNKIIARLRPTNNVLLKAARVIACPPSMGPNSLTNPLVDHHALSSHSASRIENRSQKTAVS